MRRPPITKKEEALIASSFICSVEVGSMTDAKIGERREQPKHLQ